MKIVIVTDIPSPYQVELFDALAKFANLALSVIYVRRAAADRMWNEGPISHDHCFLCEEAESEIRSRIMECDLAVFNGYRSTNVRRLIALRHWTGKAWAFWGERPGYRFRGWLGVSYRAWALRHVRRSRAPIWGIGAWAVEGYQSELGRGRLFFDVPYFSNLAPYFAIERHFSQGTVCRFLFSGSFTHRKGIDLVVSAFGELVKDGYDVELHLLGAGPLESALKAQSSSFASRVYMHGFKQWRELAPIYANANVLCAPSRYDGWGMVVVEGLAAGMPVISTYRTGAARELLEPKNGWIIPVDDQKALLSAMRSAASQDADHRKVMSGYARQIAAKLDLKPGVERFMQVAEITLRSWVTNDAVK